jgi:DNA mismatch endonuclease (patch repair protein)
MAGTPDIVLPKSQIVIFVHGCFWHQHHCPLGKLPKSNQSYWLPKLRRNQQRDASATATLRKSGWKVITIWECEARDRDAIQQILAARLK